jgi:hypothetical protein
MINIKDFIDSLFFLIFKRRIFNNKNKNNNNLEPFPETFPETFKNENEDNYEEIWFLRDLKE